MGRLTTGAVLLIAACATGCAGTTKHDGATTRPSPPLASDSALAGLSPQQVDHVVEVFNRGMGLMDQYRPTEAAAAFEEVVRLCPGWVTGRVNLGIALLNTENDAAFVRSEEELRKASAMDPGNPYAHFALGLLYSHLARSGEARHEFERVLQIDPDDPDAHYQLAILLVEDDPRAARRHLETTLEEMPHHESACYRLYTLLRREGETERANQVLARFQELKSSGAGVTREMKYGEMGRYSHVMHAFASPTVGREDAPPPVFTDVAATVGLDARSRGTAGWPGEIVDGKRASFGPGAACADVDGDGDFDVLIPGVGLHLNESGRFKASAKSGIDDTRAVGAYFGDYEADGDPDLYLTCDGPNRMYRNEGNGTFTDVTASCGTPGGDVLSVGAAWADADHDGDLDLYVANYGVAGADAGSSGVENVLWRNNGDGTFTDVAPDAGIDGGKAHTTSVMFFDADDDLDLDLYLINDREPNQLFRNDRVGRYTNVTSAFAGLDDAGAALGALFGDVDANGREDVLLLRGPEPPRLFLQTQRARFEEDREFGARMGSLGGAAGGLLADVDNDGDLDLVLLAAGKDFAHAILMNTGAGRFALPVTLGPTHAAPNARGAVAADFDADGSLELLVATADGDPELWRPSPPPGRHWLTVIPARAGEAGSKWIHPEAVGLFVELKTGRRLHVGSIASSSGYLGNPPPVAHFGLGEERKVDYARLSWPDAVLQGELEIAADHPWRVVKAQRKPSSCPILFSWDGERFAFVTDFLGVGGMGFFFTPGVYGPPDPTEDVRVPPELIRPDGGRYLLRVAEPLEEVTYLDEVHLVAYDHPREWEIHPDERFTGATPLPTGRPLAAARKIFPASARTERGEDVLDRVLDVDRRYVMPPRDRRFVGYARDHWVELDFSDRLEHLPAGARVVLYLYGWVEYTYSHVNYAAYQAGLTMQPPSIEVPDGRGGWRVAVPDAGFPAGLPRMMTLDVTALRGEPRMRIRTNMEVYWDQIFAAEDVSGAGIRTHTLRPVVADLRHLGYPREYSPDGADPTLYDYRRVDQGLAFKNLTGHFTRFGDVRELLSGVDDRFVIMGRGEEIALEFDATALPALPVGYARTIVLHSDGYCKDMDLYTAQPDDVEPLPYHAMDNYPPAAPRTEPKDYQDYRRTWNTRRVLDNE
jgi:hypothetical protein